MATPRKISVVICTHNRAAALRETLECLLNSDRHDLEVDVVVVDNNSSDDTKATVQSFANTLAPRYLFEAHQGKSYAVNCALTNSDLQGDIVAFLDDDISVHPDWFRQVAAICGRWSSCDIFSGSVHIVWPTLTLPGWAHSESLRGWAFSFKELHEEQMMRRGQWPLGGHFWVRARALRAGRRFHSCYFTEAEFALGLMADGWSGIVMAPRVIAGHRIQEELLDKDVIRNRALLIGLELAELFSRCTITPAWAMVPAKPTLLARIPCARLWISWWAKYALASLMLSADRRFERQVHALVLATYYGEMLRRTGRAGFGRTDPQLA
jgi:glycosyltransferase involved in cell wall biosynthesis